ncbi:MAG: membrane or secreted protein [Cytophagaceae bacterium]|nr:MAG: membrane or secreted protein [Cytophagaceae bacterium]
MSYPLLIISSLLLLLNYPAARAQAPPTPTGDVFVDTKGVLRWQKTKAEVALFGVNYTAPFAYSYRALTKLGIKPEQAIDQDVYHLSRLGVDAFRVHVWDIEVSDTLGNLQQNEHLRLLDYLITKLKERNIKIILTPIAYWGNAYPEPTNTGRGFSSIYDKSQAYTNPRAIRAQENYLGQFLNHRNQYSGLAYREDPGIIAYEVCNEPNYRPPLAPVLRFANRLVAAMRATGLQKPIFYNIAESPQVKDAILDANVQGFSFQWYPEGLVAGHELKGNLLPYVDQYPLPYRGDKRFDTKAKMVYEFESADVLQPIMYPFMAKSFREAGFQWATQFAYDPMGLAAYNTEYQTHYLNLAYTPAKALSLLVASRVFHETRRGQSFGRYPDDTVFGAAHVSYRQQLSEWNAPTEFYYTASTRSRPVQPARLRHVAGVGSSAVVQYGGSGAYFLDQVRAGVWRLEVMPDAVPLRDPFGTPSLSRVVTQIAWNSQPLTISLPDLGPAYLARSLTNQRIANSTAEKGLLLLWPGTYLLTKSQDDQVPTLPPRIGTILLGEFVAPKPYSLRAQVRHAPASQTMAGKPLLISAVASNLRPTDSVLLVAKHYYGPARVVPMQRTDAYTLEASIPAALTYPGLLHYWLLVKSMNGNIILFPGQQLGNTQDIICESNGLANPLAWDFADATHYEVLVVDATAPMPLFQAGPDRGHVEAQGLRPQAWVDYPTTATGHLALRLVVAPPKAAQPVPAAGPAAVLRAYLGPQIASRQADLASFKELVIKVQTNQPTATQLRVLLITKDAVAYAATVPVAAALGEVRVPLSTLQPAPMLLSPRPYPGFLPLTFSPAKWPAFRLAEVEVLQLVLDGPAGLREPLHVDIESVMVQ